MLVGGKMASVHQLVQLSVVLTMLSASIKHVHAAVNTK